MLSTIDLPGVFVVSAVYSFRTKLQQQSHPPDISAVTMSTFFETIISRG
jgi:hypothetical protein